MSEAPSSNKLHSLVRSKKVWIPAIALGIIAALILVCNALTPNRFWGPGVLKDSPVDMSILEPLAGYESFTIEELDAWVDAIDDSEGPLFRERRNIAEVRREGRMGGYRLSERNTPPFASLAVFDTPENADAILTWNREEGFFSSVPHEHVILSDNIEATLWSVYWYRSSHLPFLYDGFKITQAEIRVGNVEFSFSETLEDLDTIGNFTNEALQQIVDAFEAANIRGSND